MSTKSQKHSATILTPDQDTEQTGYSSFFAHTQSEQLGVRLWLAFWPKLWHDYNKLLNYRQPCSINNLLIQVDVWFRFPTRGNELLGLSDPSDKSNLCPASTDNARKIWALTMINRHLISQKTETRCLVPNEMLPSKFINEPTNKVFY